MINKVVWGDCLEVMKNIQGNSVDAVVTDPPYGLSFMGKKWDYDVPSQKIWEECLMVLKPGGYLLSFAGTRTQHRMAVNIEDAGFEIRDMIAWVYGSGFPKSLDIGKAVDKLQGNEREVVEEKEQRNPYIGSDGMQFRDAPDYAGKKEVITKGTSEWEGWGTALKPALEPITVARKPLSEKTVAENVLKWGTGGINIDKCRIGTTTEIHAKSSEAAKGNGIYGEWGEMKTETKNYGRFPANLIHDGSDEVVSLFPISNGSQTTKVGKTYGENDGRSYLQTKPHGVNINDYGSAARFFYCAKASKAERNMGCEGLEEKGIGAKGNGLGRVCEICGVSQLKPELCSCKVKSWINPPSNKNNHPTVKPIALMEYLVKLVSREGATVLDPFAGSGSTLVACKKLGRNYIGIEKEEEYTKIAEARIEIVKKENRLF